MCSSSSRSPELPSRSRSSGECAELVQDERVFLALLASSRLIRGTGGPGRNEIEAYHDRIRETVVARLEPEVKRDHHRRLALALEASGAADPEVLGVHFVEGGQPDRATDHFVRAADQAAEALAFDRAAGLYRRARDLQPASAPACVLYQLNSRMGDALANAGRGGEAAAAYLAAVLDAPAADAIELQRKAAMQFLISGHIDDGLSDAADRSRGDRNVVARHAASSTDFPPHAEGSPLDPRPRLQGARSRPDRPGRPDENRCVLVGRSGLERG